MRGIRVHVAEAGSGPAVVLQHGFPQDWRCWQDVQTGLAGDHRVICPDMRGFGGSDAPRTGYRKEELAQDLLAVCDALGLEEFSLGGHDWGGVVAFIAALRAPERVRRLVLVNTAHLFLKVDLRLPLAMRGFWYMPICGAPGLGSWLLGRRWFVDALLGWAHPGGPPWGRELHEAYIDGLRDPARRRAGQQLYWAFVTDELPRIVAGRYQREHLSAPTLMLHGDADRAVRPAIHRGHTDHAESFEIRLLPGVGHFAPDEVPEAIAEAIRDFVRVRD